MVGVKKMVSEAKIKANAKYDKSNTKQVLLKLNKKTDADIIEHLNNLEISKMGYIKAIIRKDMKKEKRQ